MQVTIFLEELCDVLPNFDYDAFLLPINGAQFTSGFHAANPNSKIPVLRQQGVLIQSRGS